MQLYYIVFMKRSLKIFTLHTKDLPRIEILKRFYMTDCKATTLGEQQ